MHRSIDPKDQWYLYETRLNETDGRVFRVRLSLPSVLNQLVAHKCNTIRPPFFFSLLFKTGADEGTLGMRDAALLRFCAKALDCPVCIICLTDFHALFGLI